jgi:signal transduction histidine kinase
MTRHQHGSSPAVHPLQRVLLVDDSADDVEWLHRLLTDSLGPDLRIESAGSLAASLTAIRSEAPDLVIADLRLPDGSGIELAEQVRALAPVIVITGQEQSGYSALAISGGAAEFLVKNEVSQSALARACLSALTRFRLKRELAQTRAAEVAAAERERQARCVAESALAEERRSRDRVTSLLELATRASAVTSVDEAAAVATAYLGEMAEGATLYTVEGDVLRLRASVRFSGEVTERWRAIPLHANTPLSQCARTGELVLTESAEALRQRFGVDGPHDSAWVALPLRTGDGPHDVVGLRYSHTSVPGDRDLDYLRLVAKTVAEALRRARLLEAARASAELEERLLAVLGHDLRSPLDVVGMSVSLLRSGGSSEKVIDRIERAVATMRDLIADILARAQARRGLAEHAQELRSLREVVTSEVEQLRAANPSRVIELEVRGGADFPCHAVRITQVVSNLVRNALHHGDGTRPVEITLTLTDAGAELGVSNTGPVIPAETMARLFVPFARGARSKGSGLGLFIVHETITNMGGSVSVTSAEDATRFRVQLPRS